MPNTLDIVFMLFYVVVLCVGGYFGWKAHSKVSLIMSVVCAALVLLGTILLKSQPKTGYAVTGLVAALLVVTFMTRFLQTHKVMPALPLLALSLGLFLLCLIRYVK